MQHTSHPKIILRLKRAEGHMRAVIAMMEDARPCLDIAHQLHAVESAIARAKKELIQDHIEHCLNDGQQTQTMIHELKQLAKYL
jgi:DNA-binding FrmR family transcriptional regulator